MSEGYKGRIGSIIRDARKHRGLTQQQLAERLSTSQSAINRIEKGHQNLSLEMLARIGSALDSEIVALGAGPTHLRVKGPTTLSGTIDVKTSKNAGVALLCASLLNRGRTTLRKAAHREVFAALGTAAEQRLVAHLTTNMDGLTTTFAVRDFGAVWAPFRGRATRDETADAGRAGEDQVIEGQGGKRLGDVVVDPCGCELRRVEA